MKNLLVLLLCFTLRLAAQQANYKVTVQPDTILAVDGEALINIFSGKTDLNYSCLAHKGGGTFSEFKLVQTASGQAAQVVFRSPFPGEVEFDIVDAKFNKIGSGNVTVAAPKVEILEEKSLDRYSEQGNVALGSRIFPLLVKVTDHNGHPIKTAKLFCKLQEIVNKKFVSTTTKASEFKWVDDHYEATMTGLKAASYRIEVIDEAHLESYDRADNRDYPHPSALIEGLNIE